ncbi:hypothetical protein [Nonomuraea dietziae]
MRRRGGGTRQGRGGRACALVDGVRACSEARVDTVFAVGARQGQVA